MSNNNKKPQSQKPSPNGILHSIIGTFINLNLISLCAWLILLLWFTFMLAIKGHDETYQVMQHIIIINLDFIENSHSLLVHQLVDYISHFQTLNLQTNSNITSVFFLQNAITLIKDVTEIDFTRIIAFIIAIPVFCILLVVSVTDGLVKRDIRKFQGARESTFMFHRSKHLFWFALFMPFFIYMSAPYPIYPIIFSVTQALLLSFMVWISISYFKKYV